MWKYFSYTKGEQSFRGGVRVGRRDTYVTYISYRVSSYVSSSVSFFDSLVVIQSTLYSRFEFYFVVFFLYSTFAWHCI